MRLRSTIACMAVVAAAVVAPAATTGRSRDPVPRPHLCRRRAARRGVRPGDGDRWHTRQPHARPVHPAWRHRDRSPGVRVRPRRLLRRRRQGHQHAGAVGDADGPTRLRHRIDLVPLGPDRGARTGGHSARATHHRRCRAPTCRRRSAGSAPTLRRWGSTPIASPWAVCRRARSPRSALRSVPTHRCPATTPTCRRRCVVRCRSAGRTSLQRWDRMMPGRCSSTARSTRSCRTRSTSPRGRRCRPLGCRSRGSTSRAKVIR